jgi:hypothetical protein
MPAVILNPNRGAMGAARFVALFAVAVACLFAAASPASAAGKTQPSSASGQMQRFDPSCGKDGACEVWKGFRVNHPFPTQVFAGQRVADRLVLIFSEPALPKSRLEPLIKAAFGARPARDADTAVDDRRRRLARGHGRDRPLAIRQRASGDRPSCEPVAAGSAVAARRTTVGHRVRLQLEAANAPYAARARGQAPNLDPRPGELNDWLSDATLRWRINASLPDSTGRPFQELVKGRDVGAYASTDNELTLLLLNSADIEASNEVAGELRARLARRFSLVRGRERRRAGCDLDRQGLHGHRRPDAPRAGRRHRATPLRDVRSPGQCRYARARAKLRAHHAAGRQDARRPPLGSDWAPIYLSKQLIDTEFGALLNITDQMLKSWSMAGQIDYLYFDYPLRPTGTRFAFGAQPLSEIVFARDGSRPGPVQLEHDGQCRRCGAGRVVRADRRR